MRFALRGQAQPNVTRPSLPSRRYFRRVVSRFIVPIVRVVSVRVVSTFVPVFVRVFRRVVSWALAATALAQRRPATIILTIVFILYT